MKIFSNTAGYMFFFLIILSLNGCQGAAVPHLAADVIMLEQGMSKKEVRTQLGEPDLKRINSKGEKWIYSHINKSLLRKTPLIGGFMGSAQVDVLTVEFRQDKVTDFQYQSMTPEKFEEKGYHAND